MVFQSPSGVLGVCRGTLRLALKARDAMFQSPSGVLGVCRILYGWLDHGNLQGFQSPSGVLGVCRGVVLSLGSQIAKVSVPFRGFRGLQVGANAPDWPRARNGSVPFRGFRGLQGWSVAHRLGSPAVRFQSPSGVLGVCRRFAVHG